MEEDDLAELPDAAHLAESAMADTRLAHWQTITAAALFSGYAGYYICRVNFSVATPLMLEEFASQGVTKERIGEIASVGVLFYAIGKISNGLLADYFGGRFLFLLGLFGSVACTVAFGLGTTVALFMVAWAANRYVQSMGWVSLVKVASRWYPVHRHATVMGFLAMSYLLGDAFAKLYLGSAIALGVGWRGVFFVSAATLAAIGGIGLMTLKASPQDVGAEEPEANPANVFGSYGNEANPEGVWALLAPLLRSLTFWLICVMNFGLTLIRETFNFWTPTFLFETTNLKVGQAAISSLMFPLVGATSALFAGIVSDRLGGRHGRVVVPAMAFLIAALWLMGKTADENSAFVAVVLVCAVAFFLIAPYSYLSGVMALDLGGKRGSSTTAGLVDSAGYIGAIISGKYIGKLAGDYGWASAFRFLALVSALTMIAAVAYWLVHEYTRSTVTRDRR